MKVRIKFSKYGPLKFIGHLDVMRYFQKAIRRCGIDIAFSEGYSPHQIMSFAAPLSVGHTSEGEYFDIEVNSFTDEADLMKRLQSVMVEGIDILKVSPLSEGEKNAMASVAAASYLAVFQETALPEGWQEALLDFYAREEIFVTKKTKKGERTINLRESIYGLEVLENVFEKKAALGGMAPTAILGERSERGDGVYLLLNARSGENVKPAFVLERFFESMGYTLPENALRVHRIETFKDLGTEDERKLVPLIWEK